MRELDLALFYAINHGLASPWLDPLMWFLSWIGQNAGIWVVIAVVLWLWPQRPRRFRRTAVLMGTGNLTALLFEVIVKPLVGRPRPSVALPDARVIFAASNFSFPSGHALGSFAAAAALYNLNPWLGRPAIILAALISFSRIYVGNHYPADVIAGAAFGWWIGWYTSKAMDRWLNRFGQGAPWFGAGA